MVGEYLTPGNGPDEQPGGSDQTQSDEDIYEGPVVDWKNDPYQTTEVPSNSGESSHQYH